MFKKKLTMAYMLKLFLYKRTYTYTYEEPTQTGLYDYRRFLHY